MIKKPILFLSLVLIFTQGCKKEKQADELKNEKIEVPDAPENAQPVSGTTPAPTPGTTLVYRSLNLQLAYNQPVYLDADADGKADFVFYSVLIQHDDKPHLYLLVSPKSVSGSKVLVQPGPELVVNGAWTSPLEKQITIENKPANGSAWSESMMKGFVYGVSKTATTEERMGLWIGKIDKYLGIQFKIAGKTHYGWIRLSHQPGADAITVSDYAYNTLPEQGILAGTK